MKRKVLVFFLNVICCIGIVYSQQSLSGIVRSDLGERLSGVTISEKGLNNRTQTNSQGEYSMIVNEGAVIVFSNVGYKTTERTATESGLLNVEMESSSTAIEGVEIVGAMGMRTERRALGSSVQSVSASDVAQTQRENFVNALQGRVAGLDIVSSSGVPGASSSIILRGISSISSSNQPLIVIDGLPADNSTQETGEFGSGNISGKSYENRGVDFTNRSADFNADDIESITVLKGPEAAALYGIEAANGAIIIETKRGKKGKGAISYNNSFRVDKVNNTPEVQKVYGLGLHSETNTSSPIYFGPAYTDQDTLYDNTKHFFQTALTHRHNLSFEGGAEKSTYRISAAYVDQKGVVPTSHFDRINLTAATRSELNKWLTADVSMNYAYSTNNQPFKGAGGPLLGLLIWPQTDDARNYLEPDGSRRRFFTDSGSGEIDNPFYDVKKNHIQSQNNRLYATSGLTIKPTEWLSYDFKLGFDVTAGENEILRHPESNRGITYGGLLDVLKRTQKNITFNQRFLAINKFGRFGSKGMIGHEVKQRSSNALGVMGENFMDPDFISINNSPMDGGRASRSTLTDYRIVSVFGSYEINYDRILYLTLTGRNDWSSTLPVEFNSFFYPSASLAFNFTDLKFFDNLKSFWDHGKFRISAAKVGRDARAYKIYPALEYKDVVQAGYGYGYTAPNLTLKPEMATSWEIGGEMTFFKDRLNLDIAYYKKETKNQIVNDVRASYGTGFILTDMNGGHTRNKGLEVSLGGYPVRKPDFEWDTRLNFAKSRGELVSLPADLPESYNSDTWLYGNIRNGAIPGKSIMSITGYFYMRNKDGELLISPSTGLPIRESEFVYNGSDRWPDWNIGWHNRFNYKSFQLSFLLDFRKGGDVFNATMHYLTTRGLSMKTLDRMEPRVIKGVLRDGLENTDNPTTNNIVITPQYQNNYYRNMSEEYYIEKNINWVRMRDITLSYRLPSDIIRKQKAFTNASVFITATDVFLITNYTGADPIVNGNTAAVGGSGAIGIDYGNFPMPIGINFGVRVGL